jgi:spermidine synthase
MKPRELLATAQIPGGDELRLYKRDTDFIIALGANELMSSRSSGSEEALALQTCDRLRDAEAPHLLIGGYGMGFTLRAALARLGPQARFTVVELIPEIIDWARGQMAELTAGCLDDPRVTLMMRDVVRAIRAGEHSYDAILLDVDNGPNGLTRPDNDELYSTHGLVVAKKALKPGGVLAVWSAAPDERFPRRLKHAGFEVEEVMVRAGRGGKGARHIIWFARV